MNTIFSEMSIITRAQWERNYPKITILEYLLIDFVKTIPLKCVGGCYSSHTVFFLNLNIFCINNINIYFDC